MVRVLKCIWYDPRQQHKSVGTHAATWSFKKKKNIKYIEDIEYIEYIEYIEETMHVG